MVFCEISPLQSVLTGTVSTETVWTLLICTDPHDDVINWKHFPRYWPFVRRIHRSPVNSPHKGQWRGALMFSLICGLNKRLSKQSWGWWFETQSLLLWRHCNVHGIVVVVDTLTPNRHQATGTHYIGVLVTTALYVSYHATYPIRHITQ